ncbi:uncharacterized protein LOC134695502 isoform X1 [Mytilus trossulus]|uniref:uncharacterized protein LOC134695502 isoform X1 n=2 Tax=Mytilus trossulus TaxID=6551 RepID=UPI00300623E4
MKTSVLTGKENFQSLKPPDLSCCTKQQLQDYFENSYELNESLFLSLKEDDIFYKCPDRLRLPLIFYFCHTSVVYVNKLVLSGLLKERVNLEFETMFETGVDEMSWDDTENYRMGGSYKWPSVNEVMDYRRTVRNIIIKMIQDTPLVLPITKESPWWGLLMGMEHERIHLETSSVLIRQLPVDMVTKPDGWVYGPMKYSEPVMSNPMIRVEEREVTYGKPDDFPSYGWDNEYGEETSRVPAFEASKYLVTNREYLEFVHDGGYSKKNLWTEEGWGWKLYRHAEHPAFWVCDNGCKGGCGAALSSYSHCHFNTELTTTNGVTNGQSNGVTNGVTNGQNNGVSNGQSNGVTNGHTNGVSNEQNNGVTNGQSNGVNNGHTNGFNRGRAVYKYRAMFDVLDMPLDWPVEVNYHEAHAFCSWKGSGNRLLTEAEMNVIRDDQFPPSDGPKSDVIYKDDIDLNLNLKFGSSTPVNMFPATEAGFHDVYGNVWHWTEDHFNGLYDYRSHYLYDDFSSPCFDGRHNIILGGSWISTGDEASRFARYAFRRHFIQHAGFRLARSLETAELPARLIDSEVFVLGIGVQDNPYVIEEKGHKVMKVPTTNKQYGYDEKHQLYGILEQEFGYRDPLPLAIARLCKEYKTESGNESLCWIGCGTGIGPMHLHNVFQNILAIDYGGRFIDTALKLQKGEQVEYTKSNGQQAVAMFDGVGYDNVVFKQLTWLPNEVNSHSMTVVTFLDRTLNPKAWLARLWEVTKEGGLVLIVSDWESEKLQVSLQRHMVFIGKRELSYQDGNAVAMMTIWKRI